MPVTIVDIAKSVGVSHPVVSKVLNGGKSNIGVSSELRARIQDAALQMGYRPHAAGAALRNRRFDSIGLLLADLTGGFHLPQPTMYGLSSTLQSQGYACSILCAKNASPDGLLDVALLRTQQVDALIMSYVGELSPDMTKQLAQIDTPTVWMGRRDQDNSVALDEASAAVSLTRHLGSLGHRRIMFVDYSSGLTDSVSRLRLSGFEQAARSLGIDPLVHGGAKVPRSERYEATRRWLTGRRPPRAVIASSMSAAQAILQTALHLGVQVPSQLAIASFDDGTGYDMGMIPITSAISPLRALGEAAADMAIFRAKSHESFAQSRLLTYELKVGASTVPVLPG